MSEPDPVLSNWADVFRYGEHAEDLPTHYPQCLGCGRLNIHGFHLQARRQDDTVVARHTFDHRHVGAPGIAHGGAVATVVDELFGYVLYLVGTTAVTRHLQVDYLAPVLLGTPYLLTARLDRREGRKLWMQAEAYDPHRNTVLTGRALFITVGLDHFVRAAERDVGRVDAPPPSAP